MLTLAKVTSTDRLWVSIQTPVSFIRNTIQIVSKTIWRYCGCRQLDQSHSRAGQTQPFGQFDFHLGDNRVPHLNLAKHISLVTVMLHQVSSRLIWRINFVFISFFLFSQSKDAQNVSDFLMYSEGRIISNRACLGQYGNDQQLISPAVICSQSLDSRQGACNGDGGAPLVINEHGTWTLIGTLSFLHSKGSCGRQPAPAAFTRITSHFDWIAKTTGYQFRPWKCSWFWCFELLYESFRLFCWSWIEKCHHQTRINNIINLIYRTMWLIYCLYRWEWLWLWVSLCHFGRSAKFSIQSSRKCVFR